MTLGGQVTDARSGAPIRGARVTLTLIVETPQGTFGRRPRQALSGDDGAFSFDGLDDGQYTLNVEKPGFASYPDVFGDGAPERITIDAGRDAPSLAIALEKGAVIAGRILNADGEPEPEVGVAALRRTDKVGPIGFAQNGHAQTNDIGEFRIAGLPAGDYLVMASADRRGPFDAVQVGAGPTLVTTYFPGTRRRIDARILTVTPGQVVTAVEFAIEAVEAFRVSGVVLDRSGRPSPRAMVMLLRNMRLSESVFTPPMMMMAEADGTFAIGAVAPGTYRVEATAGSGDLAGGIGGSSFLFVEHLDGAPPTAATTITVSSGDVTGVTVVARPPDGR